MIRRLGTVLTVSSLALVVVLVFLAAPLFADPEFEVVNNSSEVVSVVAEWRHNEMRIERIEPGSSRRFGIDDEAAMTFRVRYAGGRQLESEPVYFTGGTRVIAVISADGVEVRHDHEY